jgi:diguanylate cyclase (GGDEF)-like protein
VTDRRALPGTIAGIAGLVFAVVAMLAHQQWLLFVAAACTVVCGVLVLTAPDVPLRYRDRKRRHEEAERLARESDQLAARAARFEAEAIEAREKLASSMLAEQAAAGPAPVDLAGAEGDAARSKAPHVPATAEQALDLITDIDSGVFNQVFFDASLAKRISAARRGLRPLTVALLEAVTDLGDVAQTNAAPRHVAEILTTTLREADTVARTEAGLFCVLLEDTPENGAIWTLERVRRRITEEIPGTTVRAGMSCYPAYAFDSDQIMEQARAALDAAREWHQDRIEVTTASPDD